MANDTRTASEIERDIELERAQFRSTAQQLQERFAPERLLGDLGSELREYGADYGRTVARAARDNPIGLALTGIGLAWLAFGGRGDKTDGVRKSDAYGRTAPAMPGRADPLLLDEGYRQPGGFPSWAREDDPYADPWAEDNDQGALARAADGASDAAGRARDAATGFADRAGSAAGDAYDSARERLDATAAGARSRAERLRSGARETRAEVQARVARLRARLAEGTEDLSSEARERVIAARARAVEARDKAHRAASKGHAAAGDFFREQPLVAGALAVAAGAAIGGALPRSRTEDRYMGAYSDALMREAEAIYREERSKLERVAEAASQEAKSVIEEAGEELKHSAQAARDKAEEAAERVGDAAKDEADRQDLGNVRH